ncbi:BMS1, partial [Symbiodinium sp. KB8]
MLQALVEPIDTVHGVELQEVKRHLDEWRESIQKEIEVLETSGTLRRIPLQEAKRLADSGEIVLVPSKTVHTVKPPSGGSGSQLYKRKTRMVICGNYVSNEVEVYTAAANAESVRVALSLAARRRWAGAVTDVNSAFTLAPMDEAEIKYGITMETDPAVWRLVPCDNHNNTLALMVIYVDDVMMLAPENIIKEIYEWLTVGVEGDEGWKCSPMEWIGKAPVRYLGMDIRRKDSALTSFHVSQGSYVGELLKGYPAEAARPSQVPATKDAMPSLDDFDEEAGKDGGEIPGGYTYMGADLQWSGSLQAWVEEAAPEESGKPLILRVDNTAACGEVQAADMGTKPVPVARLVDLRKLWGMCSAEDFEDDEEEVIVRSLRGGDYYDLLRMMAWMMMVSRIPGVRATGIYNKKPLDYDGSVEFYVLVLIGGIALLAVWEAMKWVAQRLFGEDEATVAKARRLLRIRNQASKALQQELESMSASSSDPINIEKPSVSTPRVATVPLSEASQGFVN